ncbi:transglutaminase domain-containing protein [Marinithermofilum abyssi]|nr:transglutaminase-like domain-containing protein [Marinithermofilum abyssi]
MRQYGLGFIVGILLLTMIGCARMDVPFGMEMSSSGGNQWDRLALEKNQSLDLEKLQLSSYAEKAGAQLSSPRYQTFAVNERFRVKGSAARHAAFQSDVAWIEVVKKGTGSSEENTFSYYAPLREGRFDQDVRLFDGKGTYQVTVRLPSMEEEDRFYDIARFEVINVNPRKYRDIAYTRAGRQAGLYIEQPARGRVAADGRFKLQGRTKDLGVKRLMLRLEKGDRHWEQLISVKNGAFYTEVPLLYGKGEHKLTVMLPDPQRDRYFNEGASLLIDNRSSAKKEPIVYFKHYQERGVKLTYPLAGGDKADMKYRIRGQIDPDAPFAKETKHLIVQTKKDGLDATYFVPVKNYRFDGFFWLRFGPGKYEVTVNVPEITQEQRDYFRFFGVARFHVVNTAQKDLRNLLPSRGIQSDSPAIRQLAEDLTRGKRTDREKALAIYEYVAKTMDYDVHKFRTDAFEYDDSALKALREKTGVCQDYSFLAAALLRSIQMETRFVQGFAEGNRHAWIEVKVDGRWLTMDPTWGSGYLDGSGKFVKRYTTEYFDPNPAVFSKTHTRTGVLY